MYPDLKLKKIIQNKYFSEPGYSSE